MIHAFGFVIKTIMNAPCLQLYFSVVSVLPITVHLGCSRMLFNRSEPSSYLVYIVASSRVLVNSLHICHCMSR